MVKINIYLLVYLFILSNYFIFNAAIAPKSIAVDSDLSISSLDAVETRITVTVDDSITQPLVKVTLLEGELIVSSLDDVVYYKDSVIYVGDIKSLFPSTSSEEGLSISNQLNVNLLSIFGIVLVTLFSSSRSFKLNHFLMVIALLSVSLYTINALNVSGVSISMEIHVPVGFKFNSVNLKLKNTNLNLNNLNSNSLTINNCIDTLSDDSLTIDNSMIQSSIDICSNSDITMLEMIVYGDASISSTQGSVSVDLMSSYTGALKMSSKETPNVTGPCQPSYTNNGSLIVSTGVCNGDSTHTLSIIANNGNITLTMSDSCPVVSTFRGKTDPYYASVSPAIATTTPEITNTFPYPEDWAYMNNPSATLTSDATSTLIVRVPAWDGNLFYLASTHFTTPFSMNLTYQVKFDFKLGEALNAINNISSVSLVFLTYEWGPFNVTRGWMPDEQTEIVARFNFTGTFADQVLTPKTLSFKPSADLQSGYVMALRVQTADVSDNISRSFYFNNIRVVYPSRAVVTPTLVTKDSQVVQLRKPPAALDPQNYANCPFSAQDLVFWHDPSIWPNQQVPFPNSVITLPENTKVLITSCSLSTGTYQKIVIPQTSQLIFDDTEITMNVKDIYVQGQLLIGTKDCRLNSTININFYGDKVLTDTIAPYMGSKGIAASSTGFISINGRQYHPTWSRLAATAWPGDSIIYLQDSVNWEVGQEIVLTTSLYQDEDDNQNEVHEILAVQGAVIQLKTPLQHMHFANDHYQVEVGLLSRRIQLRSMDGLDDSFGGHVMMMGEGQISGVQLINMGQQNIRARYPLHYHLAGELTKSYITDCSIVSSFYRCITIHGTHQVQALRNVAFGAYGHCYYLEDGVEENNTIAYNLAAYVHTIGPAAAGTSQQGEDFIESATLKQPADSAAGGFYITNAYNHIYGNAASGGWASYSFPNLPIPIGNFANRTDINPSAKPTLEFDGNTAHSAGYKFWFGACIYVGGLLTTGSDGLLRYNSGRNARETMNYAGTAIQFMQFTNTKTSLCPSGVGHWGDYIELLTYESHDNEISATVFGQAWVNNALVNAESGNVQNFQVAPRQGFQFYDTWTQTILTNVHWINFHPAASWSNPQEDNRIIVSMTHSDIYKPQGISATTNFTYSNSDLTQYIGHRIEDTGSSRYFNFMDFDGTSVNSNTPKLIGSHSPWWNFTAGSCTYNSVWNTYVCKKQGVEITNIDVIIPGIIDPNVLNDDTNLEYVGKMTLFGDGGTSDRYSPITKNVGVTGVSSNTGSGWYMYMNNTSPSTWNIQLRLIPYGQYIIMAVPYPSGTSFNISTYYEWDYNNQNTLPVTKVTTFASLKSGNGRNYYFDNTHLYLKLVNHLLTNDTEEYFTRGGAKVYTIFTGYYYNITASCSTCTITDKYPTITI